MVKIKANNFEYVTSSNDLTKLFSQCNVPMREPQTVEFLCSGQKRYVATITLLSKD